MIFRQLFDGATSTFTYLIGDEGTREAVLIDCVFEQHSRDLALVRELELTLKYVLETHVHADHVTGAWLMQQTLGSQIALARAAGADGADVLLDPGDTLRVGGLSLEVLATPGHTAGCVSYVMHDQALVFTGDALLIRGAGRTDFQQGNAQKLFRSVREQLFRLPPHYLVYPGHDYNGRCASSIAEERKHNVRLGDRVREQDFVGYMNNLGLPHPKRLAIAVPANLRCGRPEDLSEMPQLPNWGPIVRTYAGVLQVEPEWVYQHKQELTILDVREHPEVASGDLGSIEGALVSPLSTLRSRIDEVPTTRPVICVCPSGARSAIAATILEQAGVPRVANLRGGLIEWRNLGLPVA